MRYEIVLWDFDGTLVDTSEGIFKSLGVMFDEMKLPKPSDELLQKFIGPPLLYGFQTFLGMDFETATRATALYRADYAADGIYRSHVCDGNEALIKRMREDGAKIGVATLKPEKMAKMLLDRFSVSHLIDVCVGTAGDQLTSPSKAHLIEDAIARLGGAPRSRIILIGDTVYDADGARESGIDFVGVSFGFGQGEVQQADFGGAYVAGTAAELERFFFPVP